MYKHGPREGPRTCPSGGPIRGRGARVSVWRLLLAVGEGGGPLRDAAEELHGLDAQGEALAILALVHVEAGELLDAVEAVANGVAMGKEVGGGLGCAGVVAEVGGEVGDELGAVARV